MKRTTNQKRHQDWLSSFGPGHSQQLRDQWIGFGVSCVLHVLLLLTLSLIAIGTGAVPMPSLLVAAPVDGVDSVVSIEPASVAVAEPLETPEVTPDHVIDFAITDLEASLPKVERPEAEVTDDSTSDRAAKTAARRGRAGGSELETMKVLAAAGIQSRVAKAGGRQGEVQFALAWKNVNDVDLHVIAPSGEHISHQYRRSQCGGMLDVDMNIDGESVEPVENVRWLRNAPWGRYTILVNLFKIHAPGARRPKLQTPYQLLAQLGSESSIRENVAGFGEQQVTVWRFVYVPDSKPSIEREQLLKQFQLMQEQEESLAAPLLEQALAAKGPARQRMLQHVVQLYPHTDAAIEAMQSIEGEVVKRSNASK